MKDLKKYSQLATKILNVGFGRMKDIKNFDSVKVLAHNSDYGVRIQVSFVTKKPFGKEMDFVFQSPEIKNEVRDYLKILPIEKYDLSINTVTKEFWEERYLPYFEKEWSKDKLEETIKKSLKKI